jgi:hypothetical protein
MLKHWFASYISQNFTRQARGSVAGWNDYMKWCGGHKFIPL